MATTEVAADQGTSPTVSAPPEAALWKPIRAALVLKDRVIVQAGAGIVADSNPAREFAETEAKAQAVLRALALAKAGD